MDSINNNKKTKIHEKNNNNNIKNIQEFNNKYLKNYEKPLNKLNVSDRVKKLKTRYEEFKKKRKK